MISLSQARVKARATLANNSEVDYLLCAALNKPRSYLYSHDDARINAEQYALFCNYIARRSEGEPVAYIIGHKEFWSLQLNVSPATLIPRPETELLVETLLSKVLPQNAHVCDLGTGTGAVALAVASEKPNWQVVGVDRVSAAVKLAVSNAKRLQLEHVEFLQSDWFSALSGRKFDAILSNPPYVEDDSPYLKQGDLRFEPTSALTAGKDGLSDIRVIVQHAVQFLNNGGWLMIEHGFAQHNAVAGIMREFEMFDIAAIEDFNQHPRVTIARLREEHKKYK